MMFTALANPARFMAISGPLALGLATVGAVLLIAGLWLGLTTAPQEQDQGDLVRIMFVHVPVAALALTAYAVMAGASLTYYVWRHALADEAAKAAAPIGAACAAATLITGSLWGKPTWGAWWAWDARLASMLVLFLTYLAYLALRAAMDEPLKAARASAILCLIGAINLPIVRFSVEIWDTLHQPAGVLTEATDPAFRTPLLLAMAGAHLGFGALVTLGVRTSVLTRRAARQSSAPRASVAITQAAS